MAISSVCVTENHVHRLLESLKSTVRMADEQGITPLEDIAALRCSGLLGALIPKEYGGLNQDVSFVNWLIEQIATVSPSIAIIAFQHISVSARILEFGTEDQRNKFLPKLACGEWLAASAWSESGAGANKQKISTIATRLENGNWCINGSKTFTTGAGLADIYLVLVQTEAETETSGIYGNSGQSFFLVPSSCTGVSTHTDLNLSGMRGSSTGFIQLNDCEVSPEYILGELGTAPNIIASVRESGLTLGAVSVGISQAAYNLALEHVYKRNMEHLQTIRFRIADMKMKVEAARAMVQAAARRDSDNRGCTTLFSKIYASEISEYICREAQQITGGSGFVRGHGIERLGRDARAVSLMGPVNDLAREIASLELVRC